MSEIFDFKRFLKYYKMQFIEQKTLLIVPVAIFFALLFFLNCFVVTSPMFEGEEALQTMGNTEGILGIIGGAVSIIFIIITVYAFWVAVMFLASLSMDKYHIRRSATPLMMLPVSKFEKFLAPYLTYVFILPIVCMIILTGVEWISVSIVAEKANGSAFLFQLSSGIQEILEAKSTTIGGFVAATFFQVLSTQAIFFAGSVFFNRYAFFKVLCVLIGIRMLVWILAFVTKMGHSVINMLGSDGSSMYVMVAIYFIILVAVTAFSWFWFKRLKLP